MPHLQLYRGPASSIPSLEDGEPGFTTDTHALYIGDGGTNYLIGGSGLSVTMGGDVTGNSSSCTVAKINGAALGTTTPTSGNVLIGDGSDWDSVAISGDATIVSSGALTLANSGVTAATYGDASHVPQIAVDAKGRITSANNIAISTGFSNPMTTLGDIIYENATPAAARLAGNTTSTKNFLTQTGTGSVSAAPAWGTIAFSDLPAPSVYTNSSCSGTVTLNLTTYNVFVLTLTGNTTLAFSSPPGVGYDFKIQIIQDATGGRTLTWPTSVNTGTGVGLTPASSANLCTLYGMWQSSANPYYEAWPVVLGASH